MAKFNERLKLLRKEKGLKQHELAKFLNMSLTGYNQYELGHSEPGFQTTMKLASFFNVSIDFLVGYTDDRNNSELLDMYKKLDQVDKMLVTNLISRLNSQKK